MGRPRIEQYEYGQLKYADEGYYLSFVYQSPLYDDNNEISGYEPWYHYPMIEPQAFIRTLKIKPLLNGEPFATSVDILGKNIDGKLVTVKILAAEDAENGVFSTDVYKGKYFVKAQATEGTMETYSPDALVWSEAAIVEPEAENWYVDDWQPTCAMINIAKALAPLEGSSVIEGTITLQANARKAFTRGESGIAFTVFLKDQSTDKIIAQTQTDASGKYRFENVPIGDYIVVPNIDGYRAKAATPLAVKVSKENETITDVDCTMAELSIEEIFQEGGEYLAGDADNSGEVDAKDITAIVDYLLGKNPEKFNKKNADANNDKKVNIADIVEIVNTITNKE